MIKNRDLLLRFIPVLLVIALAAGLSNLLFRRMVSDTVDDCLENLSMVRDESADEISTRLNSNIKMLNLAADGIMLNADLEDEAAVRDYLSYVVSETIFDRIDVIFPNGSILVQTTGEHMPDNGEKTYEELIAKGSHISQRVADFLTGRQAVHAFSPVYNVYGEPVAILGATIYCTTLADTFSSNHYEEDSLLFLVDMRDGDIVLDQWNDEPGSIYDMQDYASGEEYSGEAVIADIMAGQTGRLSYASQHYGQTAYMVYRPIEGTSFALILVAYEAELFASVNDLRQVLLQVGGIEVLLLAFFALWVYVILRRSTRMEDRALQAELALLHQKEEILERQYAQAAQRQEFLESMALNLPGGYHRCTTDYSFQLSFVSKSFTQITGYTLEQVNDELDGSYMGIVAPEDREYFMSLAPQLERDGYIQCVYRMRRRDGVLRWVQDVTQFVERDGEKYYQCALVDISDHVEELEHAKQAAEESSRAKSTFLFNISHDIRTPMNAIKGFSRIIEENAADPQLVLKTIGKIQKASDSLMMLINDVLDISRIERGKEELNLKPENLYELGKNLYEMFAADMQAAGIRFEMTGDCWEEYVYCDHLKLTRIMMNIISNAMKFTPAGGTITVGSTRLSKDDKTCTYCLFVRDTGIGMSPEFVKRAFEQFERERTSTESGVSGSGLGLSIVKMLVDLMGGTVDIHSELGKGTQISATLTFRRAESEQTSGTAKTPVKLDMTGKRVLLVEDNTFNREIAKYILEGMHFAVEEAENGAVCIEKLESAQPGWYDLILMDIQMPIMDGYTATQEIRNMEDKRLAEIPIVAMTANAFEEDRRKSLETGMNGHIGKPIDTNDLVQMLSEALK